MVIESFKNYVSSLENSSNSMIILSLSFVKQGYLFSLLTQHLSICEKLNGHLECEKKNRHFYCETCCVLQRDALASCAYFTKHR
jgi:hypothetical protein